MQNRLACAICVTSLALVNGACSSASRSDSAPTADDSKKNASTQTHGDNGAGTSGEQSVGETAPTPSSGAGTGSSSSTGTGTGSVAAEGPSYSASGGASSSDGYKGSAAPDDGVVVPTEPESRAAMTDASAPPADAGAPATDSGLPAKDSGTVQEVQGGSRLTAGLWDDNANYDVFLRYLDQSKTSFGSTLPLFTGTETSVVNTAFYQRRSYEAIDIALMLDTTGSMSDELSYIQTEFLGISRGVTSQFPNVSVHWSLVAYRDEGDEYVTMPFDFTGDTDAFRSNLSARRAEGGGDEPEAVATAFQKTLAQSWRGSNVAQMLLWVADAPHHGNDTETVKSAISTAHERGIHIYPVASSDANPLAEATMRVAAQYTGGRYLFLTNDSGIGNSHAEPKVPCYYVTKFNDAIVRSIAMEIEGTYVAPASSSIVRVVGTPSEAKCLMTSTAETGPHSEIAEDSQAPDAQQVDTRADGGS